MNNFEERLAKVERDLAWIISYLLKRDEPVQPSPYVVDIDMTQPRKVPNYESITKCVVCGMEWKGVMMYSCQNMNCPVQLKTSSYTTIPTVTLPNQTYNNQVSTTYGDIESLDPDQRSWVYDGFGVRRPKDYE